jgi:hypothetical protein
VLYIYGTYYAELGRINTTLLHETSAIHAPLTCGVPPLDLASYVKRRVVSHLVQLKFHISYSC